MERRSVKAVSSVIASILMLMIVMALGGVTYFFVSGSFESKTQQAFTIIDTYNDTVTISNSGTKPITSMRMVVDGRNMDTAFDATQDLIAYWKFNEGTGTTTKDKIQGIDLSLGAGSWVDSIDGRKKAYQYSGSWVSTNFPGTIGNGISYALWFKLVDSATDSTGTFFCVNDDADPNLEDNLGQNNYGNSGDGVSWTHAGFNTNDDDWHMFAFSKDIPSVLCKDNTCIILGDGTGNIPDITDLIVNGGCGHGYSEFTPGIILDDIKIYDTALTKGQMTALYYLKGEPYIESGDSATIQIPGLSSGKHSIRLCTPSMCTSGHLTIL